METSALLRGILDGDEEVLEAIRTFEMLGTSVLTVLECRRAFVRLAKSALLREPEENRARRRLDEFVETTELVPIDDSILERASKSFPIEPVRSLDAIHLASILWWCSIADAGVISCDARIRQNAKAYELEIFPEKA